jgi:hypothetical protein
MSATEDHGRRYRRRVTAHVLSSPRARRRAGWITGVSVVVGLIAAASILMPSRSKLVAEDDAPAVRAQAQPAAATGEPPTVPAPRAELTKLLDAFIPAVIARKDLAAGWDLVTADARGKRSEWLRGITPFQEYAARLEHFDGWTLNYSYPGDVGFDVFVAPKDPNDVSMAFRGEAKKVGGTWRIAVFYPQATFQPAGKEQRVWADTDLKPQAVATATRGRLSAAWLLFPVGIVGAALAAGIAFAVVRWTRRRGRVREIERELALLR